MFQAELSLLMMDEDDDKQHFSLKTIQDEEKKSKKKKKKNKKKAIEEKRVEDTFKVRDHPIKNMIFTILTLWGFRWVGGSE